MTSPSCRMCSSARLGIGYLPQEASIFRGLSVEQNIRAVLEVVEPSRKKREIELDSLLDEFNITRLRKTPSIALSGGERRRVEIARALATRPNYMLLDEPFAGIDPIAVGDIQDLVRHLTNRGIGVLITDHNVRETLGLTDRAYIVYAGEILTEGSPDEIVNDPDVRRLYLGEEFRLDAASPTTPVWGIPQAHLRIRRPPSAGSSFPSRLVQIFPAVKPCTSASD